MVKKSGSIDLDLTCHLDPAVFVPPCVFNSTEKCDHCYEGLITPTDEVNVRLIALLDLLKSAQSNLSGERSGSIDLKCHLDLRGVRASMCIQRDREVC